MASPVMQALVAARIEEEPTAFGKWCLLRGIRSIPAAPAHVAAFIRECEPHAEMPKIWKAVQEISQAHLANGFADPTAGGLVAEVINSIAKVDPPRSWPAEHKREFLALPYNLQLYVCEREKQRDKEVRRCQQIAAETKQERTERGPAEAPAA